MIDAQLPLWVAASAVGFAAVAAGGVGWWALRSIAALRAKLDHSEQARAAAHERSRQARQQVAQLQQALAAAKAELAARPADAAPKPVDAGARREQLARRLDDEPTMVLPRREVPADGFADTMPFA